MLRGPGSPSLRQESRSDRAAARAAVRRGLPGRRHSGGAADGTVQLVRVAGWHDEGGGRWLCLLRWGDRGVVREGWYVHDPGRLTPSGVMKGGGDATRMPSRLVIC
jgi:hypothetical protein